MSNVKQSFTLQTFLEFDVHIPRTQLEIVRVRGVHNSRNISGTFSLRVAPRVDNHSLAVNLQRCFVFAVFLSFLCFSPFFSLMVTLYQGGVKFPGNFTQGTGRKSSGKCPRQHLRTFVIHIRKSSGKCPDFRCALS